MSTEYRRLYRSRTDRMVGGVAGGLGKYFSIDPTLVRLLFIIGTLAGGPGLLAYIILLIIVPEEPLTDVEMSPEITGEDEEIVE